MKKKNTRNNKNTSRNTKSSTIEQYLREQRWSDLRTYFTTAEATEELHHTFPMISSPPAQPRRTTPPPPLWTAVFHRAPLDILQQLHTLLERKRETPTSVPYSDDLLHVALEASSSSSSSTTEDPRRQYEAEEYYLVIQFLVDHCCGAAPLDQYSNHDPSGVGWSTLQACTWKEAPVQLRYTPLGHAVSNPRVPATVVQYLCQWGPEALDWECTVVHTTTGHAYPLSPLALAVALPTTRQKTEKVCLLLHGSQYYYENGIHEARNNPKKETKGGAVLPIVPPLTSDQVDQAIHTAADNGEWYVVQELARYVEALPGRSLDATIQHKMETYYATHDQQQRQREFRYKYFGMYVVQWNI